MSTENTAFTVNQQDDATQFEIRKGAPWGYAVTLAFFYALVPFAAHFGIVWFLVLGAGAIGLLWLGAKINPLNISFRGGLLENSSNTSFNSFVLTAFFGSTALSALTPDYRFLTATVISLIYGLVLLGILRAMVPWRYSTSETR